jgi:hypothetical protein
LLRIGFLYYICSIIRKKEMTHKQTLTTNKEIEIVKAINAAALELAKIGSTKEIRDCAYAAYAAGVVYYMGLLKVPVLHKMSIA